MLFWTPTSLRESLGILSQGCDADSLGALGNQVQNESTGRQGMEGICIGSGGKCVTGIKEGGKKLRGRACV